MPFLARLGKFDRRAAQGNKKEKPDAKIVNSTVVENPLEPAQATSSRDKPDGRKRADGLSYDEQAKLTPASGGRGANTAPAKNVARSQISVNDFISKTKNQHMRGLKPSGPELFAYARYLGIDPVVDHDLLWIAEEALEAPLPSNWTEHFDNGDRVFYYNAITRVSSWTHPLEHAYRDVYRDIVNFRNANLSPQMQAERLQALHKSVKQMDADVHAEISQWKEHVDEQGNRFYFNREGGQSTWTDPRPAKCQVLNLQMKMLNVLLTPNRTHGDCSAESALRVTLQTDAVKRPKVGVTQVSEIFKGSMEGQEAEAAIDANHSMAIIHCDTSSGSDSGSVVMKRKKKKKKKKKCKISSDAGPGWDTVPPRPCTHNMKPSQSEPSVGLKSLALSESHSGLHHAASVSLGFDNSESLNTIGRARLKAGVRLEPITSLKQHEFPVTSTLEKSNHNSKPAPSIP